MKKLFSIAAMLLLSTFAFSQSLLFTLSCDTVNSQRAYCANITGTNNHSLVVFGPGVNAGGGYWADDFLQTNLSTFPINSIIDSAFLDLSPDASWPNTNPGGSQDNAVFIQKVTSTWNQNVVTFSTEPTYSTTGQINIAPSSTSLQYTTLDLTSWVRSWVTNPSTNYGIRFTPQHTAGTAARRFCWAASTDTASVLRPKFRIYYRLTTLPTTYNSINQTVCSGHSYSFNGHNLTAAGTYFDTLINYLGGDSMLTMHLSVTSPTSYTINHSICSGSSYTFNNQVLTTAGIYFDTLTNAASCDSFITLNLVVNSPTSSTITHSICSGSGYYFNGVMLANAGVYYDTIPNAAGCDSLITLNLIASNPSSSSISKTICSGSAYNFNGKILNTAGTYFDTIPNAAGCDSVITLTLSTKPSSTSTISKVICVGSSYYFGGKNLTNAGGYLDTLVSYLGCDSIVTLNLSVSSTLTTNFSLYPDLEAARTWYVLNQCASTQTLTYVWSWGDGSVNSTSANPSHTYATPGFYTICVTASEANGCTNTFCDTNFIFRMSNTNSMVYVNVVTRLPSAGIANVDSKNTISVYPNPANEWLMLNGKSLTENTKIEIVDLLGRVCISITNQKSEIIHIESLTKGVYFLKATDSNGFNYTTKFVKE